MNESLLHFIWQHQYFNAHQITGLAGEKIQIIHPGTYNKNQGPDFLNARIRIGDTLFAGSVELHVRTSDWEKHGHETDANYKNVILHVVYTHDRNVGALPTIELQPSIPTFLLHRYDRLLNNTSFIPCQNSLGAIKKITWTSWKERLLVERLERKTKEIQGFLEQNQFHWEETFWWLLARNFGIKANTELFLQMAKSLTVTMLAKHKNQIQQVEALLFGQCNLLEQEFTGDYPRLLQREYRFLKKKYGLTMNHFPVHFLRMRPSNFPTIRLAQLAMLIHQSTHLFSRVMEATDVKEMINWLSVTANDYWHYHYRLDEPSVYKKKQLGRTMTENIMINTIVPMLFAYGHYHKDELIKDRAIGWLMGLAEENNSIIENYKQLNIDCSSAFDSQALLELNKQYCSAKRCLQCSIGISILKN